ncbi:Protein of unknown function [Pyronema omphalodes CBS 100304]|uniref:Uncharacterized protein n=1 Tax=Pyronema omphalodes (strain CBS 100304) TaxID=1076935 RepID=U4LQK3_PYROM|nr:Protein of unknown function [Pyronema omphalodes CBS 100304]
MKKIPQSPSKSEGPKLAKSEAIFLIAVSLGESVKSLRYIVSDPGSLERAPGEPGLLRAPHAPMSPSLDKQHHP